MRVYDNGEFVVADVGRLLAVEFVGETAREGMRELGAMRGAMLLDAANL